MEHLVSLLISLAVGNLVMYSVIIIESTMLEGFSKRGELFPRDLFVKLARLLDLILNLLSLQ